MQQTPLDIDLRKLQLKHPPLFNKEDHDKYVNDWRGQYKGQAAAILKPINTKEVSSILLFAHENNIHVVPQGGNTGLAGGKIPMGEVLISLTKMKKIREVSKINNSMIVEAGATLQEVHNAANIFDRQFPLILSSQGS